MRYQADSKQVYEYFSSVEQRTVEWLWYPYIPYGKITVLQGDPGEGKSTFILNVAALVTQGKALPDGYSSEGPHVVVYQCAEDNLADTIKPRLVAAGADCEKVVYIINQDEQLNLDDERIEQTIRETSARMCILDPLQSFLLQEGDMHSVVRMRNLLSKLGRIAAKYRCAIVLVSHLNKSTGGKMLYRSLGSIDIAAVARSVLMISRDEDEPKIRCLSQVKSSLAPCGATVRFSIGSDGAIEWVQDCEWKAVSKEMMLTEKIKKTPNWHMQKIYSDEGKSGTSTKRRKDFQQMILDAADKQMDLILCASVSRFARNVSDCITKVRQLKTMNPSHPVGVYFETENIYTLDPESNHLLSIHAMLAEWESANKSRRMILSYDQRICTGQYPVCDLLGLRHTVDGDLIIQEEEAKTVRFAYLARYTGISDLVYRQVGHKTLEMTMRTYLNAPMPWKTPRWRA